MRKKISEFGFYEWLRSHRDNAYYNYQRKGFNVNGKRVYGTMYWIDKVLTDAEKSELSEYPNIMLLMSQCQYAPEIKHNVVVVMDRKIR